MKRDISTFTLEDIQKCVKEVSKKIIKYDRRLLELSCHEQATAHQIGCYLKKYYSDWNIDCEYDRKGTVQKELPDTGKTDRIRLDIIIHRREKKENLLCIETKKRSRPKKEFETAKKKLQDLTDRNGYYGYRFGLLMILKKKEPYIECEWFHNGNAV
jgi:hypothetical protein